MGLSRLFKYNSHISDEIVSNTYSFIISSLQCSIFELDQFEGTFTQMLICISIMYKNYSSAFSPDEFFNDFYNYIFCIRPNGANKYSNVLLELVLHFIQTKFIENQEIPAFPNDDSDEDLPNLQDLMVPVFEFYKKDRDTKNEEKLISLAQRLFLLIIRNREAINVFRSYSQQSAPSVNEEGKIFLTKYFNSRIRAMQTHQ